VVTCTGSAFTSEGPCIVRGPIGMVVEGIVSSRSGFITTPVWSSWKSSPTTSMKLEKSIIEASKSCSVDICEVASRRWLVYSET